VWWKYGPAEQRRIGRPALAWGSWQVRYRRGRAAVVFSFLPEGCREFAGGMDSTRRRGDLVPLSRGCARAHPDALHRLAIEGVGCARAWNPQLQASRIWYKIYTRSARPATADSIALGARWAPRLPGQPAWRLHPHALVRAALDHFDRDRRAAFIFGYDDTDTRGHTRSESNTHGARGLTAYSAPFAPSIGANASWCHSAREFDVDEARSWCHPSVTPPLAGPLAGCGRRSDPTQQLKQALQTPHLSRL